MYLKTLNITKGAMVAPIWRARTTVSGLNQARVTVCRAGTPPTGGSPSQKLGLSKRTQRVLPLLSELVDVQVSNLSLSK